MPEIPLGHYVIPISVVHIKKTTNLSQGKLCPPNIQETFRFTLYFPLGPVIHWTSIVGCLQEAQAASLDFDKLFYPPLNATWSHGWKHLRMFKFKPPPFLPSFPQHPSLLVMTHPGTTPGHSPKVNLPSLSFALCSVSLSYYSDHPMITELSKSPRVEGGGASYLFLPSFFPHNHWHPPNLVPTWQTARNHPTQSSHPTKTPCRPHNAPMTWRAVKFSTGRWPMEATMATWRGCKCGQRCCPRCHCSFFPIMYFP